MRLKQSQIILSASVKKIIFDYSLGVRFSRNETFSNTVECYNIGSPAADCLHSIILYVQRTSMRIDGLQMHADAKL